MAGSVRSAASRENSVRLLSDGRLRHIAFIMDGNGRWAERRGMPRRFGHSYGAAAFKKVVRYCGDIGITCVTVYAFSTENWQRPEAEVSSIMKLLVEYLGECERTADRDRLKVRFIGDLSRFEPDVRDRFTALEKRTADHERELNIAINYGGRDEIVHAVNRLISEGRTSVTEEDISGALYTAGLPDPDLIVRTAGEYRTSNFLMWQSAYSDLYFTDTLWPDMTDRDVDLAVEEFYRRKRRFGRV